VVRSRLEEPGRRSGPRGDATRAPSQAPRPGWAAGRRPSASRDWPQSDQSLDSFGNHWLTERARSLFPWPPNPPGRLPPLIPPHRLAPLALLHQFHLRFFPTEPTLDRHAPLILLHHFTSIFPHRTHDRSPRAAHSASSISPPQPGWPWLPKSLDFTTFPRGLRSRHPGPGPWSGSFLSPTPAPGSRLRRLRTAAPPIDPAK
jgi:hypothetical protein